MKLIDTSIIIEYLRGNTDLPEDSVFSVLSFYELFWKALSKDRKKEAKIILSLFSIYSVLPIDLRVIEKAAIIKEKLLRVGLIVNDFDILIAGTAEAYGIEEIWTKDKDFLDISKVTSIKVKLF